MSDADIDRLKKEGWGNCPNCGYFYKQTALFHCPMCRQDHRLPKTYTQPAYESPGLE